jgi:flagellar biosynthesis/type III secretory pathway protein FliH
LAGSAQAAAPVAPAEDPRLASLAAEIARLDEALGSAAAAAAAAEERAREEGRREGLEEAAADEAKRLGLLEEGIAAAVADLAKRLDCIETLALGIAKAGLAKVFEDPAGEAERVAAAIEAQVSRLRADAVLAVHVSGSDFPDEASLAALAAGRSPVSALPELGSGECRLDLVLGQVDAGPRTQWAHLAGILDELAAAGEVQ